MQTPSITKLGSEAKRGFGIDCEDHGLGSKRLRRLGDCQDESQEFRNKALGPMLSRKCVRFCIVNSTKFVYSPPVEPVRCKLKSWRIISFGLINPKSVCARPSHKINT
jgi:hypothetical protein